MSKRHLYDKLVDFQRTIIGLEDELRGEKKRAAGAEEVMLLEICAVLDAFENIFDSMAEKEADLDKTARRMLKSFRAVYRKLLRFMKEHGVTPIEFPNGRSVAGLCKVVEVRPETGRHDGEIIAVVRTGYQLGDRVLRSAEVITVGDS